MVEWGTPMFLSLEVPVEIQGGLGSDVAMIFDECPPCPCDRNHAERSADPTTR